MKDPNNPKQYIPDPETAPIVKRIFEMYANGIGIVKICDRLSAEKILCPSVYAFRKSGNKSGNPDLSRPYHWAQNTVRKMLSNQEYVGDTVNFKTYSKSNKLKKRLKNDPENILIFKDTHEAIIDRKTFEMVQRHFAGRKRPDKQGEMDKYAGFLFCGECGKRLYLHRGKTVKPENNNFQCGGFQSRTTECTAHYIRESILDTIVLHNIKTVTAFARDNPDEFYAMATQNGEEEAEKKRELQELAESIERMDMRDQCIQQFIRDAKRYIEMPKLTPELLRVFIRRIEVYEKFEKYSRTAGNPIIIRYTFRLPEQDGVPAIEVLAQPAAKTA